MLKKKSLFHSLYFWIMMIILFALYVENVRGYDYNLILNGKYVNISFDSYSFGQGSLTYFTQEAANFIKPGWTYTFNSPKNIDFTYTLKGSYDPQQLDGTGYNYISAIECILYNSSYSILNQYLFTPNYVDKTNRIVYSYPISLKSSNVKYIQCSDPLINNQTPILTFLSPDGITSEDGNFTNLIQNNSIQNYSLLYHVARVASNVSSYDAITDGWILGGRSCGTANNALYSLNFTKGVVLFCAGWADDLGLCDDSDVKGIQTQAIYVQNNTNPVFNTSFLPAVGSIINLTNQSTNIEACNVTKSNQVYGINESSYAMRNFSSTGNGYIAAAFLNQTQLKTENIDARWVFFPLSDANIKGWTPLTKNLSIHALKWSIIEPQTAADICVSSLANTSTVWRNLTECSDEDEIQQVGNYTTYDLNGCTANVTYNVSAENYCNFCLNSNLSVCQGGGITEGDENMIAIVLLYAVFMILGYYMIRTSNVTVGWGMFLISYLFDFFIMGQLYKEYSSDLVIGITGQLTWIFFVGFFAWIAIKSVSLISLRVRRT